MDDACSGEVSAIRNEIGNSDCHSFIISSEMFEYLTRSQIKQLKRDFEGFELILVVYLRYQDQALSSMYNELVKKHACTVSFSEHLRDTPRKGLLLYGDMLKSWERELGKKNIRVRIFDREKLTGGNVIKDMLTAIGINDLNVDTPGFAANQSVSSAAISVLRDINAQMDYSVDHAAHYGLACRLALILDKLVRSKFPELDHDTNNYFSTKNDYEELMEYYRRDNVRISRRYFFGGNFSLRNFSPAGEITEKSKRDILMALVERLEISAERVDKSATELTKLVAEYWSEELRRLCGS